MKSIILCEGKTDAILVSYLLCKQWGWKVLTKTSKVKGFMFETNEAKDESSYWYEKGSNQILICGVGGRDNFFNFFEEKISRILKLYPQESNFSKIIFIVDKDTRTIRKIEEQFSNSFQSIIRQVENRKWVKNNYNDDFQNIELQVLLNIIPMENQGALESLLLQSISEKADNKIVVDKSLDFVENIKDDASKYLKNPRLVLKAKLGTVFAIMSPQKVFSFIDEIIRSVEWEKSETILKTFEHFKDL